MARLLFAPVLVCSNLLSVKNKKPTGKKNVFYNYRKFSFFISTTLLKGKHDQVHKNKKNGHKRSYSLHNGPFCGYLFMQTGNNG
jgi:hypothetical protein